MFVAIRSNDAGRVTSIDPAWDNQTHLLRELAQNGELLCPGCRQQLWLRTGEVRRRHFAHRSLTDCPLENQSAETLESKAQLYLFLQKKFPDAVALDKAIGNPGLDRIVDVLVETGSGVKFAYWVFDREQRDRDGFCPYRSLAGVFAHFIHAGSTLRQESPDELKLSASQRGFISSSDFDEAVAMRGAGHLSFYQVETSTLSIYRGLYCVHRPNLYRWKALRQGCLESALISPKTGEVLFSEDEEARKTWRQQRCRDERLVYTCEMTHIGLKGLLNPGKEGPRNDGEPLDETKSETQLPSLNGPFRCEDCGIETTDWSSATPSAGTCVCKSCTHKRWERTRGSTPDIVGSE
jgi:Competence protein CoiA-like family